MVFENQVSEDESGGLDPLADGSEFQLQADNPKDDWTNINAWIKVPEQCCKEEVEKPAKIGPKVPYVHDERTCPTGNRAVDPNDKYGLYAHGPEGWIQENRIIPYTITYENDPEKERQHLRNGFASPIPSIRIMMSTPSFLQQT